MPATHPAAASTQEFDIVYVPLGAQAHGGAERSLMDLATRFAGQGKRVLILVGPELLQTDFPEEAARRGLQMQPIEWTHHKSSWHNLKAAVSTWRRLKTRLIHFNISWHPDMVSVALCARLFTKARLIGSMRAMPDPHDLIPRRKYLGFIPGLRLWHLPDLGRGWAWGRILHRTVTVNLRDFAARLVRDYGYPANRLTAIYNGIDVRGNVNEEAAAALRERIGATGSQFLVVFVGRLSSEKGAHLLLDATAPLERVHIAFVGDGPQRAELEALADQLSMKARVTFVGYEPHPETWMAAADVVAVPSTWYEAFGRVVVEAMNEGTPVIASRVGGMAELFEDGVQGRYVAAGSVPELRAAIETMANDRDGTRRMGALGKALVRERYSLERVEADYGRAYTLLLGENQPRTPVTTATGGGES